MAEIKDKYGKIWVNEHEKKDGGTWYEYRLGVSKKKQDGGFINASMRVRFARSLGLPEKLPNGMEIKDYEGFLSAEEYKNREGNTVTAVIAVITKAKFPMLEEDIDVPDSFELVEEDMPF